MLRIYRSSSRSTNTYIVVVETETILRRTYLNSILHSSRSYISSIIYANNLDFYNQDSTIPS